MSDSFRSCLTCVRPRVPFQEIIKKDEDIGALRATLKRANDEADARADEIAAIRTEAESLRKELAAAAEGAREETVTIGVNLKYSLPEVVILI